MRNGCSVTERRMHPTNITCPSSPRTKSGLYLTAQTDGTVVLAQDVDAAEETAQAQTFHTMEGLSDKKGVSFESVLMPGQYLTLQDGKLVLTDGSDKKAATFYLN